MYNKIYTCEVKSSLHACFLFAVVNILWYYTEYNLEFQGSIHNLQKRVLFMKFYPEMP